MSFHAHIVLPLADSPSPSPSLSQSTPTSPMPGENDATWLGPGLLGFLSLVFLAVAVFLIWKSLTKQLTRVTFDEDAVNGTEPEPAAAAAGPVASPAADADAEAEADRTPAE